MKKQKKKWFLSNEDLNFWQPASDMFSGLMLVLMLIILMLGLYLVRIPEYDQPDSERGDSYAGGALQEAEDDATPTPVLMVWYQDAGGGGGGWGTATPVPTPQETPTPTLTATPTLTPTPTPDLPGGGGGGGGGGSGGGAGDSEGRGQEEGLKAAVYVMLIDAETERTVKEAGVEFELYNGEEALQILNVYYPLRETFRKYETSEDGTFYLPEKILTGTYRLAELTAAEGYETAPDQVFVVDDQYDWPEPYVLRVPVYPSRNVIRVQMTDEETRRPIPGGSFEVVAAENIFTADGTLRYRTGQSVCEITCDEEGYGVSEEIYLGSYLLRQKEIPKFYAGQTGEIAVTVEEKSDMAPGPVAVASRRTRIHMTLRDELYPSRIIAGAAYEIAADRSGVEAQILSTDTGGSILLEELKKGTTYHIRQMEAVGAYALDTRDHTVTVDALGYIGGEAEAELSLENRMIRVRIGITDEFSAVQVPDINLALYSRDDTLIRTWTTTGSAVSFDGLTPGEYYILWTGEEEKRYDIQIVDQAEIQEINLHTTYMLHYILIGGTGAMLILALVLVLLLIRRRRRKKAKEG